MIPIIATLAEAGLGILANAVLAKGKDVIEEKIGIKLPDPGKPIDPATAAALQQAQYAHEEYLIGAATRRLELAIDAEKAAQGAVTQRWQADMLADSWLSKNIRPLVLLYLLAAYSVFSLASGVGFQVTQAYVELLAQALMLVLGAYFAGRTVEKIVDMRERGK